jgi:hypothetical protein
MREVHCALRAGRIRDFLIMLVEYAQSYRVRDEVTLPRSCP